MARRLDFVKDAKKRAVAVFEPIQPLGAIKGAGLQFKGGKVLPSNKTPRSRRQSKMVRLAGGK